MHALLRICFKALVFVFISENSLAFSLTPPWNQTVSDRIMLAFGLNPVCSHTVHTGYVPV